MSGALLAQLAWKKTGAAMARVFGTTYAQYRPSGASNPVTSLTQIGTAVPGYIVSSMAGMRPGATPAPFDPAKPRCVGALDPAVLALGDYLIGPFMQGGNPETLFVAQIAAPAPPSLVRCNCIVNVTRGVLPTTAGAQAPLDIQMANESVTLVQWPASVIRDGRGQEGVVRLASDVKQGGYLALLPSSVPFAIQSDDRLTVTAWLNTADNPGDMILIVATEECTPDGWKLLLQEEMA
jgi:hypothetical protein